MSLDYWEGAVSDIHRNTPSQLPCRVGGGWRVLQPQLEAAVGPSPDDVGVRAAPPFLLSSLRTSVMVGSCCRTSVNFGGSHDKCDRLPFGFLFSEKCMYMQNLGRILRYL